MFVLDLTNKETKMRKYLLPLSVAALAAASSSAFALQASDNFQARITIQTSCVVTANDLDFGNVGVIAGSRPPAPASTSTARPAQSIRCRSIPPSW